MSEAPKNSEPEGVKNPLTFGEYLGVILQGISSEGRERIGLIADTLPAAGFGHAALGVFISENIPEMFEWTLLAPAVLWMIGAVISRRTIIDRDAMSTGLFAGVTISLVEGFIKAGSLETGRVESQVVLGGVGLLGAAATAIEGKGLIQKLIHPQVGPRE